MYGGIFFNLNFILFIGFSRVSCVDKQTPVSLYTTQFEFIHIDVVNIFLLFSAVPFLFIYTNIFLPKNNEKISNTKLNYISKKYVINFTHNHCFILTIDYYTDARLRRTQFAAEKRPESYSRRSESNGKLLPNHDLTKLVEKSTPVRVNVWVQTEIAWRRREKAVLRLSLRKSARREKLSNVRSQAALRGSAVKQWSWLLLEYGEQISRSSTKFPLSLQLHNIFGFFLELSSPRKNENLLRISTQSAKCRK